MRPVPVPRRSASRLSVSGPVICHCVLRSGSLVVTEVILNTTLWPRFAPLALSVIGTIFLFGGQIDVIDGVKLAIVGDAGSMIVSARLPMPVPLALVAERMMLYRPKVLGNVPEITSCLLYTSDAADDL